MGGCRKGDHEEEYLLGRTSANASAALLLLRRGYIDQSSGVFRQLAETKNLLERFTHSSEDYEEWRRSDEAIRKNRYSPYNVRLKLESLGVDPVAGVDAYQLLSKYGVHPGPGTEPRPMIHRRSRRLGQPIGNRPAVSLSITVAVVGAVVRALIFCSDIVLHPHVK